MTILDTFFMVFESDTSKLDQGLDEAQKRAKRLREDLEKTDKTALRVGQSLGDALKQIAGAALAGIAFGSLAGAIGRAAAEADKLDEVAGSMDVNIETLSEYAGAVKLAGGTTEGFVGSLQSLDTALTQMEVTGKSRVAPFLKELGIDLESAAFKGKPALELLPAIAEAFEGMSRQQSQGIGRKLGLDQGTIMLLQSGRRELDAQIARQRELGVVTKEQGETAAKFNDQLDMTGMAWRSVWLSVSQAVLPALTSVMQLFERLAIFMRKHSDFVVGLMMALGSAILFFVVPPLLKAAAAAVVAFAPFLLLGAIVAGLAAGFALLYEDVMVFVEGGDSAVGRLIGKFQQFRDFMLSMWAEVKAAYEAFISGVVDTMEAAVALIMGIWRALMATIQGALDVVSKGVNAVRSFFGLSSDTAAAVAEGQSSLASASATSLGAQTSTSISNSRNSSGSVTVGEVKVYTQATDAAGISKAIGGTMQAQMRQAVVNFDDGVAA